MIILSMLAFLVIKGQTIDTLINVGKYNLHFTIIPGKGIPILFEAGGGNDGTIWNSITKPVAEITGATVITYDRSGLGKSGKDSTDTTIENEIGGLEIALMKLGYKKEIMLVSHSLGGFYNSLYASRHPKNVKAMTFIDVNLPCFFTPEQFEKMNAPQPFRNMVETVRKNPFPDNIPIVDIVSEKTLFEGTPNAARWKECHHDFVASSPNRKELTAYETGHYVFLQNPQLVINCIVTMYANDVMPSEKAAILEKGYAQALIADNENHKNLVHYWHSEGDLNEWGYSLLQKNELENALEIFKLNVMLHPESANVYDSIGDAYVRMGNKELAIENYKKALTLNPDKKSAKKALEQLLK
jgi:alpha/beta hydrolase fold/Tetratricopeptide repeat